MSLGDQVLFGIPASLRPDILERTLRSFNTRFGITLRDFTVRANVDRVPKSRPSIMVGDVVDVLTGFFGKVDWRSPEEPSLGNAARWVFEGATLPYLFYLEDDWELIVDSSLQEMVLLLQSLPPTVAQVRFAWRERPKVLPLTSSTNVKLRFTPSLMRSSFCTSLAPHFSPGSNPERASVAMMQRGVVPPYCVGASRLYLPRDGDGVVDIGRDWRDKHGVMRASRGAFAWIER